MKNRDIYLMLAIICYLCMPYLRKRLKKHSEESNDFRLSADVDKTIKSSEPEKAMTRHTLFTAKESPLQLFRPTNIITPRT